MVLDTTTIKLEDEKKTDQKPASFLRRIKKPLMERKRRERINRSLINLKILLLDNIRTHGGTQTTKLDKADILEMTVNYLKTQSSVSMATQVNYVTGYHDCARETVRYLNEQCGLNPEMMSRVGHYLITRQTSLEHDQYQGQMQVADDIQPQAAFPVQNSSAFCGPILTSTPKQIILDSNLHLFNPTQVTYFETEKFNKSVNVFDNPADTGTLYCNSNSENTAMPENSSLSVHSDDSDVMNVKDEEECDVWRPWG